MQDALFQQLLVDYRNTVLEAQGDAENAIVAYLKSHEQLVYYRAAAKASQKAVNTATIQYREGEITFNWLITILSEDLQQQDLLAEVRGSTATNLIRVFLKHWVEAGRFVNRTVPWICYLPKPK